MLVLYFGNQIILSNSFSLSARINKFSKPKLNPIKPCDTHTDQVLLHMLIAGSIEAFEVLYHRYFRMLCRSAFKRIQDEAVVEELVQDVFINLWLKRWNLDETGDIGAYLHATLRNKVLHELRREMIATRNQTALKLEVSEVQVHDVAQQLMAKELEQKIQLVLQGLSPKCREAFTLSRFDRLSYKAIAKQMNISVDTVEKHVGKALKCLRRNV